MVTARYCLNEARVDPSEVHVATPEFNEEQPTQSLEPRRVDREEVDGDQTPRMPGQTPIT